MNQMTMGGFNAGNGALGNMPMPNHGPNGVGGRIPDDHEDTNYEAKLNAYIYVYFCFKGKWELARALKDSGVEFDPPLVNDNTNGANDSMQTDSKDGIDLKRPDDLPEVQTLGDGQGGSFLSSWFALFWDIFSAQRKSNRASANAMQYVTQTQVHAPRPLLSASINPPDSNKPGCDQNNKPKCCGLCLGWVPASSKTISSRCCDFKMQMETCSGRLWRTTAVHGNRKSTRRRSPEDVGYTSLFVYIKHCEIYHLTNDPQNSPTDSSNEPPGNDARNAQGSLRHGHEWTETTHTFGWGPCTFA